MKTKFDVVEAQARLPKLVRAKQTLSLQLGDETVAFLVPRDRMEALLETMEILANPAGHARHPPRPIRQSEVSPAVRAR